MSEASSSRSHVTITLGNSGQVVKRAGAGLDGSFPDSQPAVGSKRSVRDRLGSNVDATQLDSKRHRGGATNGINDVRLGKDDLRFKIMEKNVCSQTHGNALQTGMDLRNLLSRPARPSTTGLAAQQCMPQTKNARQHLPEHNSRMQISNPRDGRQHFPEHGDLRRQMPDPRDARQHLPEHRDLRRQMPDLRDARQHMMEPKNAMQHMRDPNNASVLGRIPYVRSADASPQLNSLRTHSSPWNLDSLRRKSPDGASGTSRGLSPPRKNEELHRRPLMQHDDIRTISHTRKDVHELSRPLSSMPFMTKPATSVGPPKHTASMVPPPPAGIVQKSSYAVEEQLTVDSLMHSLGLDKYAIYFKAEEVDMAALRQMGDNDLKELGIPMGPRKKILLALVSRSKR